MKMRSSSRTPLKEVFLLDKYSFKDERDLLVHLWKKMVEIGEQVKENASTLEEILDAIERE